MSPCRRLRLSNKLLRSAVELAVVAEAVDFCSCVRTAHPRVEIALEPSVSLSLRHELVPVRARIRDVTHAKPSNPRVFVHGDITTGVGHLWGQRTNLDSTVLTNRCLYRDAMTTLVRDGLGAICVF